MTLVEILVVVGVVIILALMLLPVIGMSDRRSRQPRCGKNLSQLMGACVSYAQQEEVAWPSPWPNTIGYVPKGQPIAAGVSAMNYAFGCFEVLAHEASLTNGLFRCDAARAPGPHTRAQPGRALPEIPGDNWADAGGGSSRRISYAFDWAAPGDPGSVRVVFCDREVSNHQGKGVMACFGDSHTKFLTVSSGPLSNSAPNETIGMKGAGVAVGEVDNPDAFGTVDSVTLGKPDATPDNIFTSAGDIPSGKTEAETALTPGAGDPLRAYVK